MLNTKTNLFLAIVVLLGMGLFLAGCPSNPTSEEEGTKLEGIYQLESYKKNLSSCDSEGTSVLEQESEKFFFLKEKDVLGQSLLYVFSCLDVDSCKEKLTKFEDGEGFTISYSFTLSEGNDNDGYVGKLASTGFGDRKEGLCKDGRVQNQSLNKIEEGKILIRSEITYADDYPMDEDGFCTTTGTEEAVKGKPCSELHSIIGVFVESL